MGFAFDIRAKKHRQIQILFLSKSPPIFNRSRSRNYDLMRYRKKRYFSQLAVA